MLNLQVSTDECRPHGEWTELVSDHGGIAEPCEPIQDTHEDRNDDQNEVREQTEHEPQGVAGHDLERQERKALKNHDDKKQQNTGKP